MDNASQRSILNAAACKQLKKKCDHLVKYTGTSIPADFSQLKKKLLWAVVFIVHLYYCVGGDALILFCSSAALFFLIVIQH